MRGWVTVRSEDRNMRGWVTVRSEDRNMRGWVTVRSVRKTSPTSFYTRLGC